ncbi:MAG: penicillin acylase family protein [Deltaproteobacteria bacterium]|nr:penicillin acylase family protein [Deltaproteobacteria bacterium]
MKKVFKRKWLIIGILLLGTVISLSIWYRVRIQLRPGPPEPSEYSKQYAKEVKILRDQWGIPHIFGKTDRSTAFGLAYAHAEDDFPLIQGSLVAARGKLSLLHLSKLSIINDYLVQFLGLPQTLEKQYSTLPEDFKAFLDAYTEGLNYYAYMHPEEIDSRFFPISGKDVVAGFIHKLPLLMEVGKVLEDIFSREEDRLQEGWPIQKRLVLNTDMPSWFYGQLAGSNATAVGPNRSADGKVRININSHQPWEGPVTWYEAHVVSDEGWNMIGGTFPGAPLILHGHNQHLGWAHTVNRPDFIDVYKLNMHPNGLLSYRLDGEWIPLKVKDAEIEIDLGLFNWTVKRKIYGSVHGPVVKLDNGYYAIRYAGADRHGLSVYQWYRMNKASSFEEWKEAMSLLGIPMMNTVYADKKNIYYVYNALIPIRKEKYDWLSILPGDTSEAIWSEYLPYKSLPQVLNPPSGYLMNTNSNPFKTTVGEGNPKLEKFSTTLGIETIMNNRAIRSHELFGRDRSITRDEFFQYKFDRTYSKASSMYQEVLYPLLKTYTPKNTNEGRAMELLKNWHGRMEEDSSGAALARLVYEPIHDVKIFKPQGTPIPKPEETFQKAVEFLIDYYGKVDVPLGDIQRLRRGSTDVPIGGGKDTLNAVHTKKEGGKLVGVAGDSYILIAEFSNNGVASWAIHQYGNVNRKDSSHYDDQVPLFINRKLRKSLLTKEEIKKHLEKEYHPGEE